MSTTLAAGDIALVGFASDTATGAGQAPGKSFAFVLLKDVEAGTTLDFTDDGWLAAGGFRSGEGTYEYVAPDGGAAAGTVITVPGLTGALNPSTSGDQITAFQGTLAAPTNLFALNFADGASAFAADATNTNTSAVPAGLAAGSTALAFPTDDGAYVGPTTGTQAQLLADIANPANWTTVDTPSAGTPLPPYATAFTVQSGPDTTAPTLVSSTPAENATAVAKGADLTLTFSETVQLGTGHIVLTDTTDASHSLSIDVTDATQVSVNGAVVTLNPTADLTPGDTYAVTLESGAVTDTAGNAYADGATPIDFTVAPPATAIPTGSQGATYAITASGTYELAQGASFTETASKNAITATVSGAPVTVEIDGTLNGATGQRGVVETTSDGELVVGAQGAIRTTDGDGFQFKLPSGGGHADVTNLGSIVSGTTITTVTAGGSAPHGYALNFNAATGGAGATDHTSGGVVVNGAVGNTTALLESDSSDAVRLGANQTLTNYGHVWGNGPVSDSSDNNVFVGGSDDQKYDSSRGIEINGFSHDTIDNHGLIEGAQHGVDAGDEADTDIVVLNAAGATILGHNGSGVGSDGAGAAAASVTNVMVTNSGAIFGEYAPTYDRSGAATMDGDGDGVDVDGGATVTNNAGATIAGAGAGEVLTLGGAGGYDNGGRLNNSEGLSLGGGVVENHGLISGADYGITVNNDSDPTGGRSGVLSTQITNESDGTIVGQAGYAIRLENKGPDAIDADTIVNHGTITGGGAIPDPTGVVHLQDGSVDTASTGTLDGLDYTGTGSARFILGDGAAIQTGEGADVLTNDGTINGNSGRAISLEGGDDTLNLSSAGTVHGAIDGGAGTDTLNLTGSTSIFGSLPTATGFEMLHVASGSWGVTDADAFSGGTTIDAGASLQIGAGGAAGAITGAIVDNGGLGFNRSDAVTVDASVSGAGRLDNFGTGVLTLTTTHAFSAVNVFAGTVDVATQGAAGSGAVTFAHEFVGGRALHVESAALTGGDFANTLRGFGENDTLDVGGVGANAHATLGANNLLTVTGDAASATFHLDPTQDFSAYSFATAADSSGGANITLAPAAGAPVTLFSESFDSFTAAGFAPTPAAGQLDSDVWRVAGLSDVANPAFGFTGPAGGDFGRGVITGAADPVTAGVYSPSANGALVVQPTGAELDVGGFIEAHIVNGSGAAANPPTLDFDWTYRNSGDRADALTLSYSTDDVNFTAVPAGAFTTPGAKDATVATTFSTEHEHLDLTGLNLPSGGDLYLRWTHDSSAGSGSRDEVGIDNVLLQAQPAGPINGTAFSISALNASQPEGDAGATTPFAFTVTRAGDATAAGDVDYAVTGTGAHPANAADFGGTLPQGTLHFAAGQTTAALTVNVSGDAVTEPAETFAVGLLNPTNGAVVTGAAATGTIQNDDNAPIAIYDIQGAGQASPFANQQVVTQGVVTAIDTTGSRGFYIQSEVGDGNAATSDGVFVFTNAAPTIHVGDLVTVSGTVDEYQGASTNNLPITEIDTSNANVAFVSAGHTIAPTVIGEGGLTPPNDPLASDDLTTYDPTKYAVDFHESLEGMLVTVHDAQAVDNTFSGQTWVVAEGTAGAVNDRGGVTITEGADAAHANYEPERFEVYSDTGVLPAGFGSFNMGDHLGDVTGVVSYFGGNYELLPTQAAANPTSDGKPADDVTTLHADATHLTVGAYNVNNLGPVGINAADTATRYTALGHDIATNLGGPVILGVEEIQDADGEGGGSDLTGTKTLTDLTAAIKAQGGPDYQFVEIAPTTPDTNGGAPGGNIRSAFLYDASKVSLVAGSVRLIDDPNNPVTNSNGTYHNSRQPLVADFMFNGQKVTVIDVHQYSRGGSDELFGQDQPPTISGDDRRTAQSDAVAHYVAGLEAADPNARIVVEGDFNGFYFEKALTDLKSIGGLENLVETLPAAERYSYNFEGDSEQLDNLLVTPNLATGAVFDNVHVNTGILASAVTDPSGAATDHDPILAQLSIPASAPGGGGGGGDGGGGGIVQTGGSTPGMLMGGTGNDTLTAGSSQDTLTGGAGNDQLNGGSGSALIFGNAGADTITLNAATQASTVFGGQGDDRIDASGSTHANQLFGDLGNDSIRAGSGGDTLLGGDGQDTLQAGGGHDGLFGNAGNDSLVIGPASQGASAYGGQGDDAIDGSASTHADYLSGDFGNDVIRAGAGGDTALGGDGADTLIAGAGHDQLFGNAGDDHIVVGSASQGASAFGGQGDDVIDGSASAHADVLSGDLGNDSIRAGAGGDTVLGGDGADTLISGSGHDQLFGNAGEDYIFVGSASQGASVYGGQGTDVIDASTATRPVYLSGDAGSDLILGGGGSDTIHGGAGADTIRAGASTADHIYVGLGDSQSIDGTTIELDHVTGFGANDQIVFTGHAAATSANTVVQTGDADFAAAYAFAYGNGAQAGALGGAVEYAVVSDTAGHVYIFAADHAAVQLDGLSGGASGVSLGQIVGG